MKQPLSYIGGALMVLTGMGQSYGVVIDFDSLSVGVQPGNVFAGSGVTFRSGDIPNDVAEGDTISLSNGVDGFEVVTIKEGDISPPNYAAARDLFSKDTLFTFDPPVLSVSVTADDAVEAGPDIVRLLALGATENTDEFTILDLDETVDNITTPDNVLTVAGSPFSFALFQVTTEQEGFDDLTFTQVPEPTAGLLAAIGLITIIGQSNRRVRRR